MPATVIRMSPHRLHEGAWLACGIVVICAAGTVLFTITDGPDGAIGLLLLVTGPLILLLPTAIDMIVTSVRGGAVILTATTNTSSCSISTRWNRTAAPSRHCCIRRRATPRIRVQLGSSWAHSALEPHVTLGL